MPWRTPERVVLSHELISRLLATLTGRWLTGPAQSPLIDAMQVAFTAWRQIILNKFNVDYLNHLHDTQKLALAYFFDLTLFDSVKRLILSTGVAATADQLCVCQRSRFKARPNSF